MVLEGSLDNDDDDVKLVSNGYENEEMRVASVLEGCNIGFV